MDPFEFSFSVDKKDFAQAVRRFTLRQPVALIIVISSSILFGSILCIFSYSFIFHLVDGNTEYFGMNLLALMCTGLLLVVPANIVFIRPYLVGRQVKKNQQQFENITWVMDDDHLSIIAPNARNEVKWSVFSKVVEIKNHFLVVYAMSKNCFQIVPKSAFESPDQEARFREYAERLIAPIKKSKTRILRLITTTILDSQDIGDGPTRILVYAFAPRLRPRQPSLYAASASIFSFLRFYDYYDGVRGSQQPAKW